MASLASHILFAYHIEMHIIATSKPVIGILEAGAKIALRRGRKFGVVTTGEGWVKPLSTANLASLSDEEKHRFAGVVATGLGVLEFHSGDRRADASDQPHVDDVQVHKRIATAAKKLAETHDVDVIVMGCAGMEGMGQAILDGVGNTGYSIYTVDSVSAAIELLFEELALRK